MMKKTNEKRLECDPVFGEQRRLRARNDAAAQAPVAEYRIGRKMCRVRSVEGDPALSAKEPVRPDGRSRCP